MNFTHSSIKLLPNSTNEKLRRAFTIEEFIYSLKKSGKSSSVSYGYKIPNQPLSQQLFIKMLKNRHKIEELKNISKYLMSSCRSISLISCNFILENMIKPRLRQFCSQIYCYQKHNYKYNRCSMSFN